MAAVAGNTAGHEKRAKNEERFSVSFPVSLTWEEKTGAGKGVTVKRVNGRCIDLSPEGMKIETKERVAAGVIVLVAGEDFGRMGHAVVRHAQREKMLFVLGVRFASAFGLADPVRRRTLQRVLNPDDPHATPKDGPG